MFAVIDIETTGLDPKNDRIFEIAIILFDGEKVTNEFVSFVNPELHLMPTIEQLTGVFDSKVKDAPRFYKIAKQIVELTEGRIIIAHNARFDYAFLRKEFSRLGYSYYRKYICTEKLSREKLPRQLKYSLKHLCKSLELKLNRIIAH